jgi:recombinational DNA repair protein (RecF pathway)
LRVLPDEDPVPELFAELGAWLTRCDRAPQAVSEAGLKAFQLRSVALLGYAPQLGHCAHCGRPVSPPTLFGVSEGGVLCARCPAAGATLRVDDATLDLLRRLAGPEKHGGGDEATTLPLELDARTAEIIEAFLRFHITGYRGLRSLKSLAAWRALRAAGAASHLGRDGAAGGTSPAEHG